MHKSSHETTPKAAPTESRRRAPIESADILVEAERKLERLFDDSTDATTKRDTYATYLHIRLALALELARTGGAL